MNFIFILLRGMGQILLCGSPAAGFFFLAALFFISPLAALLAVVGVVSSTITAFCMKYERSLIEFGLFGINGALVGLGWTFFPDINFGFIIGLAAAAACSSFVTNFLINLWGKSRYNLPALSLASVLVVWAAVFIFYAVKGIFPPTLSSSLLMPFEAETFSILNWRVLIGTSLIFTGVGFHSRISALVAFAGLIFGLSAAFIFAGKTGIVWMSLYGYTCVPTAIAIGGLFVVLNRRAIFYGVLTLIMSGFIWWGSVILLSNAGLPVLVVPFNFAVLISLFFLKSGLFDEKRLGLYPVPLSEVFKPEASLQWHRGVIAAEKFWKERGGSGRKGF